MTREINSEGLGIGLRPAHYRQILEGEPGVDFFEIIVENYLDPRSAARARLRQIAADHTLVAHGVTLNVLGADPLNMDYLHALKDLIDEFSIPYASDHLCWTASEGVQHHELLPAPYDPSLIPYGAERVAFVQDFLGVPFGLENLSSYLTWRRDAMNEWDFYHEIVRQAGCWYMLDINNIYVSSKNHGFDPTEYLAAIDWGRVLQVHLAGHRVLPDGLHHDTHDAAVVDEVWALYAQAWAMGGPFPTLIEWDDQIPALPVVVAEAHKAREVRSR